MLNRNTFNIINRLLKSRRANSPSLFGVSTFLRFGFSSITPWLRVSDTSSHPVKFTPCVFLMKMFTAEDTINLTPNEQTTCNDGPATHPGEQSPEHHPEHRVNTHSGVHPIYTLAHTDPHIVTTPTVPRLFLKSQISNLKSPLDPFGVTFPRFGSCHFGVSKSPNRHITKSHEPD
jgi:hypothetical protein